MSDQSEEFPLVDTHNDGAVFAKVWRNHSQDGKAYYSVTVGRLYTDPETGQPRESRSLQGADILKAQAMLGEAYRTVMRERKRDRAQSRHTEPDSVSPPNRQGGLEAQRDAAVGQTQTRPASERTRSPRPQRGPEH